MFKFLALDKESVQKGGLTMINFKVGLTIAIIKQDVTIIVNSNAA